MGMQFIASTKTCLCCGFKMYDSMYLIYVHAFLGCYAMDSDCILMGTLLAE